MWDALFIDATLHPPHGHRGSHPTAGKQDKYEKRCPDRSAGHAELLERRLDLLLDRLVNFQRQRPAIVRDGLSVFSGDPEGIATILEIQAIVGFELERLVIILDGAIVLPGPPKSPPGC